MYVPKSQCIEWPQHLLRMQSKFVELLQQQKWCDVTLACDDGRTLRAHRIILCAASVYLERVLSLVSTTCDAYVILKQCPYTDIELILRFLYGGVIEVAEDQLASLQRTAEMLEISDMIIAFGTYGANDIAAVANGTTVKQPPSFANLALEQPMTEAVDGTDSATPSSPPAATPNHQSSDDQFGWWRRQGSDDTKPNTGHSVGEYYDDMDDYGMDESYFMAYQYGYVNDTQYESNVSALPGTQYPFVNAAVVENINKTITSEECHDRAHVSQLMCAVWPKDELAQRSMCFEKDQQSLTHFRSQSPKDKSCVPRPLTPEKLWFVRDQCFKRLETIKEETGIDVTIRKRKFTKYAHDIVNDQKKMRTNIGSSAMPSGSKDAGANGI